MSANRAARRRVARAVARPDRPVAYGPGREQARADERWHQATDLQRNLLHALGYRFDSRGVYADDRTVPSTRRLIAEYQRREARRARRETLARIAEQRRVHRTVVVDADPVAVAERLGDLADALDRVARAGGFGAAARARRAARGAS